MSPRDTVRLEQGAAGRDRYGRTLAYVWTDGTLVNRWLVARGYAVVEYYGGEASWRAVLEREERRARELGRGLWGDGGFECRPREWRAGECGQAARRASGSHIQTREEWLSYGKTLGQLA